MSLLASLRSLSPMAKRLVFMRLAIYLGMQCAYFIGVVGTLTYAFDGGVTENALGIVLLNGCIVLGSFVGGPLLDRVGPRRFFSAVVAALVLTSLVYQLLAQSVVLGLKCVTALQQSLLSGREFVQVFARKSALHGEHSQPAVVPGLFGSLSGAVVDAENAAMCAECEALLYAAARAQHVSEVILPALESGKTVLCDRYIDSSLAYQGYARGLGEEYVASINAFALKECPPDLTLFLNIPPDRAFERKHGADRDDRMEQLGLPFHMRVYEGYLALMAKYPRICPVDCSGSKTQTSQKIWDILVSRGVVTDNK